MLHARERPIVAAWDLSMTETFTLQDPYKIPHCRCVTRVLRPRTQPHDNLVTFIISTSAVLKVWRARDGWRWLICEVMVILGMVI